MSYKPQPFDAAAGTLVVTFVILTLFSFIAVLNSLIGWELTLCTILAIIIVVITICILLERYVRLEHGKATKREYQKEKQVEPPSIFIK